MCDVVAHELSFKIQNLKEKLANLQIEESGVLELILKVENNLFVCKLEKQI